MISCQAQRTGHITFLERLGLPTFDIASKIQDVP
jgi:hypothetical protein